MSLLDWLSWEPPRVGPPSMVEAMAAGLDVVTETDPGSGESVRVQLVDRSGGRELVLEWHRCRDLETVGRLLRCRHVNGDGTRCTQAYAAGYGPHRGEARWQYEREPTSRRPQ